MILTVHLIRSSANELYNCMGGRLLAIFFICFLFLGFVVVSFSRWKSDRKCSCIHKIAAKTIEFFVIAFSLYINLISLFYSPYQNRTTYTPSATHLQYFTNSSPTPETQMWSTTAANHDDYDRPKNGGLPNFHRISNPTYYQNDRIAHYATQMVWHIHLKKKFIHSNDKNATNILSI